LIVFEYSSININKPMKITQKQSISLFSLTTHTHAGQIIHSIKEKNESLRYLKINFLFEEIQSA